MPWTRAIVTEAAQRMNHVPRYRPRAVLREPQISMAGHHGRRFFSLLPARRSRRSSRCPLTESGYRVHCQRCARPQVTQQLPPHQQVSFAYTSRSSSTASEILLARNPESEQIARRFPQTICFDKPRPLPFMPLAACPVQSDTLSRAIPCPDVGHYCWLHALPLSPILFFSSVWRSLIPKLVCSPAICKGNKRRYWRAETAGAWCLV